MFNVTSSPSQGFNVHTRADAGLAKEELEKAKKAQVELVESLNSPGSAIPSSIDRASISDAAKEMVKSIGDAAQKTQRGLETDTSVEGLQSDVAAQVTSKTAGGSLVSGAEKEAMKNRLNEAVESGKVEKTSFAKKGTDTVDI